MTPKELGKWRASVLKEWQDRATKAEAELEKIYDELGTTMDRAFKAEEELREVATLCDWRRTIEAAEARAIKAEEALRVLDAELKRCSIGVSQSTEALVRAALEELK